MDRDLTASQQTLLDLMVDLSLRHCALTWRDDVEYDLWDAVLYGPKKYGTVLLTEENIAALTRLSKAYADARDMLQTAVDCQQALFLVYE